MRLLFSLIHDIGILRRRHNYTSNENIERICFQLLLAIHSHVRYPALREMIEQEEFVTFKASCEEAKQLATQEIRKMEAQLLLIADGWSY